MALVLVAVRGQNTAEQGGFENVDVLTGLGPLVKIAVSACADQGAGYIFSVPMLACYLCPGGKVPNAARDDCVCPGTSRSSALTGPLTCDDCAAENLDVSIDGRVCISCQGTRPTGNFSSAVSSGNSSGNASTCATCATCTGGTKGPILIQSTQPATAQTPDSTQMSFECTCPVGYAISDMDADGGPSAFGGKVCFLCPFNSYVAPAAPSVCTPCPDPLMTRNNLSGQCICPSGLVEDSILTAGLTVTDIPVVGSHVCLDVDASKIAFQAAEYGKQTFQDVIDVDGSRTDSILVEKSEPFLKYFLAAAVRCKNSRHWQSCQALANLCTLSLHNIDAPACKILSSYVSKVTTDNIHGFEGWRFGFPWLKYGRASRDVIYSTGINRQVALSGRLSFVNLTLSVYALDGSFLGFQDVSTQLHMCQGDDRKLQRFRRFGSNTLFRCSIDLVHLIDRQDEPRFYELWMDDPVDKTGSDRVEGIALYPLPVLITNYEEDGQKPNNILRENPSLQLGVGGGGVEALDKAVLHRRFFLWDNISGKKLPDTSKGKSASTKSDVAAAPTLPTVVRWAKHVELRVMLQNDDGDTQVDESIRMYPPHLIIEYDQQLTSTVPRGTMQADTKDSEMRYPEVEFKSIYTMELVEWWRVMMGLFIMWIILTVIYAGLKLSVRSQSQSMTWNGVSADVLGSIADWFFWGMFIVSGYWFCFFKLQSEVESLLPLENPHPDFLVFVIVAGWCKIMHVALLLYGQCITDIFFIDFEKEPITDSKEEEDTLPKVSVWRNILIANEWCEMQTERHTDIDFTLMFLLFFLKGALRCVASHRHQLHVHVLLVLWSPFSVSKYVSP